MFLSAVTKGALYTIEVAHINLPAGKDHDFLNSFDKEVQDDLYEMITDNRISSCFCYTIMNGNYKKIKTMDKETAIKLFDQKQVRVHWDEEKEKWYFSIVDVIGILAENDRPRKYWNDLKRKLEEEGSELSEKIGQLKMPAADGKMRLTDVADTEQLLRLIQSIPSPKAEPFKLWLAKVGYERIEETEKPEKREFEG